MGAKVDANQDFIKISQEKFIKVVLEKINMSESKGIRSSIEIHFHGDTEVATTFFYILELD